MEAGAISTHIYIHHRASGTQGVWIKFPEITSVNSLPSGFLTEVEKTGEASLLFTGLENPISGKQHHSHMESVFFWKSTKNPKGQSSRQPSGTTS